MGIPVKLQVFEGPLDLLLHLIDKNKIDIYDIPIVEITNQYMDYIRAMEREDLNVMSEFLVMAATLLDIKCRMLLPKEVKEDGEEEDPRQELVEQLLDRAPDLPEEVKEYVEPIDMDALLGDLTLAKLNSIFQDVIRRQADKIDPVRSTFGKIEKETVTLSQRMEDIRTFARKSRRFSFRELLTSQKSRTQIVVTFLAVLQMMKEGSIRTEQEQPFDDILITWTED